MPIRELTNFEIIIRIALSLVLGGALGIERGLKNRPAGLRTYMLVCLGACVVMMTNQYSCQAFGVGDPVRMGAQVVSGIGFLGAGTIVVTQHNQIKGLTTAAGLWAAACIGLAIGLGLYEVALLSGGTVFIVLTLLHTLDYRMRQHAKVMDAYIELKEKSSIGSFLQYMRQNDLDISNIQMETDVISESGTIRFIVTLRAHKNCNRRKMLDLIRSFEDTQYFEEL